MGRIGFRGAVSDLKSTMKQHMDRNPGCPIPPFECEGHTRGSVEHPAGVRDG